MALQSSGAISLANIQTEFGGSNPISLSEYYGAASGIPASGAISISQFYGASALLDTQTVNVGYQAPSQYTPSIYGYDNLISTVGSVSDGTSNVYSGGVIRSIAYISGTVVRFMVDGNRANSGWTTMTINGYTYNRASANTYTYVADPGYTYWQWNTTTNPFGTTTGVNRTVTFA